MKKKMLRYKPMMLKIATAKSAKIRRILSSILTTTGGGRDMVAFIRRRERERYD